MFLESHMTLLKIEKVSFLYLLFCAWKWTKIKRRWSFHDLKFQIAHHWRIQLSRNFRLHLWALVTQIYFSTTTQQNLSTDMFSHPYITYSGSNKGYIRDLGLVTNPLWSLMEGIQNDGMCFPYCTELDNRTLPDESSCLSTWTLSIWSIMKKSFPEILAWDSTQVFQSQL